MEICSAPTALIRGLLKRPRDDSTVKVNRETPIDGVNLNGQERPGGQEMIWLMVKLSQMQRSSWHPAAAELQQQFITKCHPYE